MRPVLAALLAAGLLAGCASREPEAEPAPAPPPLPPPIDLAPAPVSPPPLPEEPADTCGARELSWLVGRPRSEIPVPVFPPRRRVVCTTCPRTLDYSPLRQTIEYDADTGLVTSITCG